MIIVRNNDTEQALIVSDFSLEALEKIIASRSDAQAGKSYTKSLLDAGIERIARKFGEESVEMIVAALGEGKSEKIAEAADVLFHLLVLLNASNISVKDVFGELESRTAQSGIEEKNSRNQTGTQ